MFVPLVATAQALQDTRRVVLVKVEFYPLRRYDKRLVKTVAVSDFGSIKLILLIVLDDTVEDLSVLIDGLLVISQLFCGIYELFRGQITDLIHYQSLIRV